MVKDLAAKPLLIAEVGRNVAINLLKNVVATATILAIIAQEGVDAYNNYGSYKRRFGVGQKVRYLDMSFGGGIPTTDSVREDKDLMMLLPKPTDRRDFAEAMDFVNTYMKPFVHKRNLDDFKKTNKPSLVNKKSETFVKTISTIFGIRATKLRKFLNESVISGVPIVSPFKDK